MARPQNSRRGRQAGLVKRWQLAEVCDDRISERAQRRKRSGFRLAQASLGHQRMGEDAIVIVQHERDGARRIAELLGERGQSHGRNSDRDKAEIGVPIPDRDAIIQEGLLPLLPIDWWSPMGVLAGPNKGGERGELAVPGHVKTVDPKPRSGSSARGAQCVSLRIAQHDRLGLRCRCEDPPTKSASAGSEKR